ncbi:MAG: class I SAM-dependent methyltransferase [Candidatus Bathyarchaeia archaeon]|jgi:2-polyprenyl-3-methyl-5-hydroxy-6-metoxy-1,4-benzoquinol methylase
MFLQTTFTINPVLTTTFIDFNQKVRFSFITSGIKSILEYSEKAKLNILDIGAGLGNLSDFISISQNCSIVNVEINSKRKLQNMVVADGSQLPFVSEVFDFVVSCDVYEHVKKENRSDFVKEMLRCCKRGLVLTYSKIHAKNPSSSGIKIFEKLGGKNLDWYLEHNKNVIVDDKLLIENIQENGGKIKNKKPLVGVFGLFFTGLTIFIQGKIRISAFKYFLQIAGLLITRLIDFPPFYGFGLTVVKNKDYAGVL